MQKLAGASTPILSHLVRRHVSVTFRRGNLTVMPEIPPQLAADGRAVSAKRPRRLAMADLSLLHLKMEAAQPKHNVTAI